MNTSDKIIVYYDNTVLYGVLINFLVDLKNRGFDTTKFYRPYNILDFTTKELYNDTENHLYLESFMVKKFGLSYSVHLPVYSLLNSARNYDFINTEDKNIGLIFKIPDDQKLLLDYIDEKLSKKKKFKFIDFDITTEL